MRVAIHWFRRDVRLRDNIALAAATTEAEAVVPVYVLDKAILAIPNIAQARVATLSGALSDVSARLRQGGARLIVRQGDTAEELCRLAREIGAEAVYANYSVGSRAAKIEAQVTHALAAERLPLHLYDDVGILSADTLATGSGTPYTIYTPYARRWRERVASAPPTEHTARAEALRAGGEIARQSESVDHVVALRDAGCEPDHWLPLWGGGRTAHLQRLRSFIEGHIADYATARDFPGQDGTSRLSPAFRWGTLSQREAYRLARAYATEHPVAAKGAEVWIGELIWADFYRAVLYHFPQSEASAFKQSYADIAWTGDSAHFDLWSQGQTGYPIVDAAMRQLLTEGWMHNRARMIVASFLVKDLLLDWRLGEKHFMRHLADGDAAENVGGWQWTASTGTDAQPYFRIFNPTSQSEKFDPQGEYIRRYVPELAHVPTHSIHAPWHMPGDEQRRAGCIVGRDYPAPIVDHAAQRPKALAMFKGVMKA